jgi:GTP-binding protein
MIKGIVAIVGRPNVGKSTLFNMLTRSHTAITDNQPGVTRDRLYGTAYYDQNREDGFVVVDTGGFENKDYRFQPFGHDEVWSQSMAAVRGAHLVLFLVDGATGMHPMDEIVYRELLKEGKPILVVVNKIDGKEHIDKSWDFAKFSHRDPICIGARAGFQIPLLLESINEQLATHNAPKVKEQEEKLTKIALIGRPNVGKSSLLNRLAGETRSLVSDIPGTTRDSVTSRLVYHNHCFEIIDTAGLRKKAKVVSELESYSTLRSIQNLQEADLCVLVIDAKEGFSDQDAKILSLAVARAIPSLIVVNKWDLFEDKHSNSAKEYAAAIYDRIADMAYVPIVFVSCLQNQRVSRIMELCLKLSENYSLRVPTSKVNEAIEKIVAEHTPQVVKRYNKRIKFYYGTQIGVKPPTFIIKTNVPKELSDSYVRFLTKRLKNYLGFDQIPIVLKFRPKSTEPSAARKPKQQYA